MLKPPRDFAAPRFSERDEFRLDAVERWGWHKYNRTSVRSESERSRSILNKPAVPKQDFGAIWSEASTLDADDSTPITENPEVSTPRPFRSAALITSIGRGVASR